MHKRLNMEYSLDSVHSVSTQQMNELVQTVSEFGVAVKIGG